MYTINDLMNEHDKRASLFRIRNDAGLHPNGISALVEEVGEFAQAVDDGDFDHMREEAVDVLNVTVGVLAYLYKGAEPGTLEKHITRALNKLR